MNELNEKLAKWAGFKFRLSASENPHYWTYYSEEVGLISMNELPGFTNSLDACFRWLVPRLAKDYWIIIDPPNKTVIIVYGFVQEAEGIGETSALALCRAIEKIIDDA